MSKVAQKKQVKRKRITNSALTLFNERGFSNTRIDDIIAEAKVGKGTFYLYFKNKEQLVESLIEDLAADLIDILQWVKEQRLKDPNDLKRIFTEEGNRLAQVLASNKEMAIFINKQARSVSLKTDKMIQEFMDSLVDLCTVHFEEAFDKGQMDPNLNPHVTAMSVIGGINFTYGQWACGQVNMDVESAVEAMLAFYFNALGLKAK